MSIRKVFGFLSLFILATIVCMSFYVNRTSRELDDHMSDIKSMNVISKELNDFEVNLESYKGHNRKRVFSQAEKLRGSISSALGDPSHDSEETAADLRQIRVRFQQLIELYEAIKLRCDESKAAQLPDLLHMRFIFKNRELHEGIDSYSFNVYKRIQTDQVCLRVWIYSVLALSIASVGLLFLYVDRALLRRLFRITEGAERLGRRELDYRLNIKQRDEIGALGNMLDQMAENLRNTTVSRDDLVKNEVRLQKLNTELERSNAELQQFAYVASHDLQEPLRMVASFTELIKERYDDKLDDKGRKYIAYAIDGAKRMQALVSDLLKLSRVGTRQASFEEVDCNELVTAVLEDLSKRVEETAADVSVGDLPTVVADASQLKLVFQNLVSNALKFCNVDHPKVTIGSVERDGLWEFSVADNGIGIDPQYHDRIFVIFQRLHQRGEYDGTGIGLSIVKKIIERHDGTVTVESNQNEGATFKFTLPKR